MDIGDLHLKLILFVVLLFLNQRYAVSGQDGKMLLFRTRIHAYAYHMKMRSAITQSKYRLDSLFLRHWGPHVIQQMK